MKTIIRNPNLQHMKLFVLGLLVCISFACSKETTYVYYSDMPHNTTRATMTSRNDSLEYNECFIANDSCISSIRSIKSWQQQVEVEFLENNKVLRLDSFYYIKEGVKSKDIFDQYVNRVVKF